jgi:hypothetical protein
VDNKNGEAVASTFSMMDQDSSLEARPFCRLLKSEVIEIEAAARDSKQTTSEWVRKTLLEASRSRKREPEPTGPAISENTGEAFLN